MEQKRVDVLITLVGFLQLLDLAIGGAMIAQFLSDQIDVRLLVGSTAIWVALTIAIIAIYILMFIQTKQRRK